MKDKINSFIWQHFLLLTFFLAYIQTTDAKGQSPCFSYGASIMNGDLYCGHQEDSAFAMHSVMKFPQALYVADYLHKKGLTLSDSVLVHKDSLDAETWSPMLSIFVSLSLSFILRSLYFTLYCTRTLTVSTASWEWTHEANKQKCQ